jgi:hypothetical protein
MAEKVKTKLLKIIDIIDNKIAINLDILSVGSKFE